LLGTLSSTISTSQTAKYGVQTDKGIFNQQAIRQPGTEEGGLVDGSKAKEQQDQRSELSWIRTSIVLDKKNIIKWDSFANGQSNLGGVGDGHVSGWWRQPQAGLAPELT
jgi:hypothetical protein